MILVANDFFGIADLLVKIMREISDSWATEQLEQPTTEVRNCILKLSFYGWATTG